MNDRGQVRVGDPKDAVRTILDDLVRAGPAWLPPHAGIPVMPWPIIPADVDIPPRVKLKVEASEAGGSGLRRWSGAGAGAQFLPALARRRRGPGGPKPHPKRPPLSLPPPLPPRYPT